MGGGDLNTKKSWHPSTLKNQERVWKAEQAAAEEKKRILELQREREQENDRAQLNEMAQRNFGASGSNQVGDNRLHWMYDKPDKQVQHEEYLLGKEIGKNDVSERAQNAIPAVSRRVVGSSMTKSLDDTQVDLVRKMREDPLLLVKERERAARAALLNNPLQRKRLADLLRKEKETQEIKEDCKTKNKTKKKNKNLDDMLAAKLNALGGDKKIDLSSLLNSNDSSSESSQSSNEESKKKKKKRKKEKKKKHLKKTKKKKNASDSDSKTDYTNDEPSANDRYKNIPKYQSYYNTNSESTNYDEDRRNHLYENTHKSIRNKDSDDDIKRKKHDRYDKHQSAFKTSNQYKSSESRKRRSDSYNEAQDKTSPKKSRRDYSANSRNDTDRHKQRDSPDGREIRPTLSSKKSKGDSPERERSRTFESVKKFEREQRQGMSSADRAEKLAAMAAAGREREVERGQRVKLQRAADAAAAETSARPRSLNNEARALPDSLESRIRSNRHYIQRDKMHMDQNFARR